MKLVMERLKLDGVEEHGGIAKAFKNDTGKDVHFAPPKMVVSGKVRHVKPIQLAAVSHARQTYAYSRCDVNRNPSRQLNRGEHENHG